MERRNETSQNWVRSDSTPSEIGSSDGGPGVLALARPTLEWSFLASVAAGFPCVISVELGQVKSIIQVTDQNSFKIWLSFRPHSLSCRRYLRMSTTWRVSAMDGAPSPHFISFRPALAQCDMQN
jgi:hypothetical protein